MSSSVFLYEPFYDVDRFLDEAFRRNGTNASNLPTRSRQAPENNDGAVRSLKPTMDLHENSQTNSVTATFELPGLKKEDVQIAVHNGRLIVSGESKLSTEHEQSGYAVRERRYGKFSRTLQLPKGVNDEEIKASMENGVLTLTFPKSAPESAHRKITIA